MTGVNIIEIINKQNNTITKLPEKPSILNPITNDLVILSNRQLPGMRIFSIVFDTTGDTVILYHKTGGK